MLQLGKEHFYKKLNINKLKEERKKIRVNKLITLQEKQINNNYDINNNLSERERYPKSIYLNSNSNTINNESNISTRDKRLKMKLKELAEKKILNNSLAYSKKICPQNKSFVKLNNYYEISTNLSIFQITNRISKYCLENELLFNQTNHKFTIFVKKVNSFVIEINALEGRIILKFTHESGEENLTKKYMIGLYSEIAK